MANFFPTRLSFNRRPSTTRWDGIPTQVLYCFNPDPDPMTLI